MRKNLISYVDSLFMNAPKNQRVRELHDEILLNTLDRYDEEIAAGQTEQAAFAMARDAIGDINELLEPLCPTKVGMTMRTILAIVLYICSVIPVIVGSAFGDLGESIGACFLFVFVACGTYLILTSNMVPKTRRLKRLRALGIALYIVSVVPVILLDSLAGEVGDILGACALFLVVALATALVIYAGSRLRKDMDNPPCCKKENTAEESEPLGRAWKVFVPCCWVAAAIIFITLTETAMGWGLAWLVFLVTGAALDVVKGIILLVRGEKGLRKLASGCLWLLICAAYYFITVLTGAWTVTWLIFLVGVALGGVLSAVIELFEKKEKKHEACN